MQALTTPAETVSFIRHVVFELDVNFHPDTDFMDYTRRDGTPSFNAQAADELNAALAQAFRVCDLYGADMYDLALSVVQARLTT